MKHLDQRKFFETDEQFANFRPLILGNKESTIVYRSASALTDRYGRAQTVRKVMAKKGINTIIDLTPLHCTCNSEEFARGLVLRIKEGLIDSIPPYIIQCDAGKKRTGFACILLESLSGSHYWNIVIDYLKSYENNNRLAIHNNSVDVQKLIETQVNPKIRFIAGYDDEISHYNLKQNARSYLLKYG